MALQSLSDPIPLIPFLSIGMGNVDLTVGTAMDAAGESTTYIGYIQWDDEATHTVSSAGGKMYFIPNNVVFATAGSTIRAGIQDVDTTTGLEDGTFDVYDDLVQGTDTFTNNALKTVTFSNGSKEIAHNSLIAVSIEMTTRNGTDALTPLRANIASGLPYCTTDTGSGPGKSDTMPYCVVEADDGALAHLGSVRCIPTVVTNTSFNSGSAADEYAMIFKVPFKCAVNQLIIYIGELDSGETGEVILYSDPSGATPVAERTVTMDPDVFGIPGAGSDLGIFNITEFTLSPNTTYAVAYKATSAGSRSIRRVTSSPGANIRKFTPFGTTLVGGVRADASGSFTTSATDWPVMGLMISKLDDGVSSGGSGGFLIQ